MKKLIASFTILVIFILALSLNFLIKSEFLDENNQQMSFNLTSACFGEKCFNVRVADTQEKRAQGLMFVKEMPENEGMLFIFEKEDIHPFWMKNTLIPLDIIWLDENQNVVFIKKNAQPCKEDPCEVINPGKPARYVLETNAGLVDKLNLEDK